MSYLKILRTYESTKDTELELRFQIKSRDVFKKLISNVDGDKTIEQSINFISPGLESNRICKLLFLNGKKKNSVYMSKVLLEKGPIIDGILSHKLTVSHEKSISKFDINLSKFARIKLRLSIRPKEISEWRVDFTLVKTVNNIKNNIKKDKNAMLFKLSIKDFIDNAPWDYADALELEVEHVSKNKSVSSSDVNDVLEYIFNIIDPEYKNMFEYQKKIYQIASYLVDKHYLEQFRQIRGIRDLYNRVWELNKNAYYKTVFPNIKNYYALHKADGVRTMVIIEGNSLFALNGKLVTYKLKKSHEKPTVYDAEFVNDKYHVFDVIAYNGENLSMTPTSNRIKYISKVVEMSEGHAAVKLIKPLTEKYKQELSEMHASSSELPYSVDGIIFTPKDDTYKRMKSWKWKPLEHMSIDFLVKEPKGLAGVSPYEVLPGHTMLFLFSGISKQLYDKLRLTPVTGYKTLFPYQRMYKNFPIQFSPSDEPFAYIYYHPNDSKLALKDVVDNVCEFRRIDLDTMPKWDIMRIRTDRKIELDRGNYFGNGFYIAEYTWQNYQNPLRFEDLVISSAEFMDRGYFKEEKSSMYKPVTGFNSFVKCRLLSKFVNSDWLIDLAAGRGQDLFRVSDAKISNALFIDNDPQALSELISRKHDFQRSIKRLNTRIYTKLVNLTTDNRTIVKSLKQIGVPVGTIDIVMCNFAIHYLVGTPDNVRNLIRLVHSLLKPGGHFFFTSFNGEKIFDLLKEKDSWDLREGEVLKYSIKKSYTSESLESTGQQIDVLLPFSGGKYYTEFLVNYKYLMTEFELNGFKTEKTGDFSSFLPLFKKESAKLYNGLSKDDIEFLSLYKYGMVKKAMTERGQRAIELKEAEAKIEDMIGTRDTSTAVYQKGVQEPWFSYIKKGFKTVEGHLNKGDFSNMKKGDIVTFTNKGKTVDTLVTDVVHYETFKEMLEEEGLDATLPGKERLDDGIEVYRAFFSEEKEKEHGVLAIKIKPIK